MNALKLILIAFALTTWHASGQSSITSPSSNQALSSPSFTLKWQDVKAREYFLYLGNTQGGNEFYGGSMGTKTQATFTWGQAPSACWVRIWSLMPVYGVSRTTISHYQWYASDRRFQVAPTKLAGDALRSKLIDLMSESCRNDHGLKKGQCKAYLQSVFAKAVSKLGAKLPSGKTPAMPPNSTGYYWKDPAENGFVKVAQVVPRTQSRAGSDIDQEKAVTAVLKTIRKGDVAQYGTVGNVESGLHTMAFTASYSEGQSLQWADSNWTGKEIVNAYQSRSLSDLAKLIAADFSKKPKGLTIYRIRDDLTQ